MRIVTAKEGRRDPNRSAIAPKRSRNETTAAGIVFLACGHTHTCTHVKNKGPPLMPPEMQEHVASSKTEGERRGLELFPSPKRVFLTFSLSLRLTHTPMCVSHTQGRALGRESKVRPVLYYESLKSEVRKMARQESLQDIQKRRDTGQGKIDRVGCHL